LRKTILLIVLSVAVFSGCNNKVLSKQQYYEKGVKYLQNGNSSGATIAFKKAIEKDQNYFEARYQLGLAYILQRKYDLAEREFLKVLRLNPSFNDAHIYLAKTYINNLKIDDAIKEIKIYFSKADDNIEAYEVAATAYSIKKDYLTAEEYLDKALKNSPDRISAKVLLADVYLESGKIEEAERRLKEVIDSKGKDKQALYVLIKIRQKQGRLNDVINVYQKIVEIDPRDIKAQLELGLNYVQSGNIAKAKEVAKKIQELRKESAEAPYLIGVIQFNEKKIDEAMISLQKSMKIDSFPGAYYYLGLCRLEKGDLEQATNAFQKVIDMLPEMLQPRLLLALTHLRKGRIEEAEKEARKAVAIDGKNALAHNLLGSAYLAMNKGDMAMEEFDRAIELDPRLVDAYIKKGIFNLQSGNNQVAEKEFISAVKVAPELLNSRIMLAKYYIKNKRSQEAINILRQGLKGNENDAVIYNIIGAAYLNSENVENGRQNFEKAISSNPKFFLPYFNLALLDLNTGSKEMAVKQYKRVLDIDSKNVSALLMLAKVMEADRKDEEALSYYMKAKETGKEIAYLSLAEYYQRKNDNKQAMKVLQEALSVDPRNVYARKMLGLLHMADRNYKEALMVYRDLKESSPEIGAEMTADVYAAMGEYDSALKEMEKLLLKDNKRIDILARIVNLYIKKKDFGYAEKTAKDIISLTPQGDAGYLILASVYMENRQFHEALVTLRKAQELNPKNVEANIAVGRVYMAMKDFQKAIEIFREIERLNPKYIPAYFYDAGVLEQNGMKNDAVEKYKKVLELSPKYVHALNNLAYLYIEGYGPPEKAVEMAQTAKKLVPKDGSVTDTLGWALYNVGKYDEALKYFIEATHYLPGEPSIRYHLALAYQKKGMEDRAEEQFKNSVRLGRLYPFPELKNVQEMLAGMKK
jgi:putative PEP-CTERM system TPR-repeat lipoprotein